MLKSILACLTGFGSDKTVMEAAFALARIDQGHVDALHSRVDAQGLAAFAGVSQSHVHESVQLMAMTIARQEQERAEAARKSYDQALARHPSGAAAYREVTTLEDETLRQARLHDLTVVARVPELPSGWLDAIVLSAGKPVVITPARPPSAIGRTVAVAWKDTAEAARAVTASLPILARAERVFIMAICESGEDAQTERMSGEGLVQLLKAHGVTAELRLAASASASDKVKELAYDIEADLIVMGAFGHGRLRELVLGGATRALIADCDIAVLMLH